MAAGHAAGGGPLARILVLAVLHVNFVGEFHVGPLVTCV